MDRRTRSGAAAAAASCRRDRPHSQKPAMMRSAVRGVTRVSAARYAAPASVFARNMSSDTSGLVRTSHKSEVQPGVAARAASGAHLGAPRCLPRSFCRREGGFSGGAPARTHACFGHVLYLTLLLCVAVRRKLLSRRLLARPSRRSSRCARPWATRSSGSAPWIRRTAACAASAA